ncbi:activating transcription factor 7-interacting protein 2-like isoform X2 [Cimex lectularius]|uniref:Fibronectin type-III domain-containing protein n=1 Tax=Cimex lectularius TaxID=79782 RepID=A0A8I6TMA6_CIMLE|nr:activating transcription factor 7-interacting protein 2-like isoform X2 [Cimex lectularius]
MVTLGLTRPMDATALLPSDSVQSDSEDPFADFEEFCQKITESEVLNESTSQKESSVERKPAKVPERDAVETLKGEMIETPIGDEVALLNGEIACERLDKHIKCEMFAGSADTRSDPKEDDERVQSDLNPKLVERPDEAIPEVAADSQTEKVPENDCNGLKDKGAESDAERDSTGLDKHDHERLADVQSALDRLIDIVDSGVEAGPKKEESPALEMIINPDAIKRAIVENAIAEEPAEFPKGEAKTERCEVDSPEKPAEVDKPNMELVDTELIIEERISDPTEFHSPQEQTHFLKRDMNTSEMEEIGRTSKKLKFSASESDVEKMDVDEIITNGYVEQTCNGSATKEEIESARPKTDKLLNGDTPNNKKSLREEALYLKEQLKRGEEITINQELLEEVIMIKVTEYLADSGTTGQMRVSVQHIEDELERLKKQVVMYRKQYEDAKRVIKKLVDDKKACKEYTNSVAPAKVTRSVGLQVCTIGRRSVHNLNINTMAERRQEEPTKPSTPPSTSSMQPVQFAMPAPPPPEPVPSTSGIKTIAPSTSGVKPPIRQNAKKTTTGIPRLGEQRKMAPPPVANDTVPIVSPVKPPSNEVIDLTDKDDIQEDAKKKQIGTNVVQVNSCQIQIMNSNGEYSSQTNNADNGTVMIKTTNLIKQISTAADTDIIPLPSPYPALPVAFYSENVPRPPRPLLRISQTPGNPPGKSGIMLSWNFSSDDHPSPPISKYQVYAYQEGGEDGSKDNWKKVGDVDALPLPMACTLTQFKDGFKYYFAVRAIDKNMTKGEFSLPSSIRLHPLKRISMNGTK